MKTCDRCGKQVKKYCMGYHICDKCYAVVFADYFQRHDEERKRDIEQIKEQKNE